MNIEGLIFKPIIPLSTMIIFSVILLVIIIINRKNIINRILILILLLIISQRPMLRDQDDVAYVLNLDVVFVIDTTVSMNSVDVNNGTRLDEVKKVSKNIMEEFPGSKFAVITYNNDAYIKYPFTDDYAVIEDVIDALKIVEPNYAIGSSLSLPTEYLKMLLESAESNSNLHDEKRRKIVFFMGDGELNNAEKINTNLDDYTGLESLIDNGAVLGFGTVEGGKIKITESIKMKNLVDSAGYLLDNSKKPPVAAISKMNEDNLRDLSSKLGIDYINENSTDLLNEKIKEIKNDVNEEEDEDEAKNDKDLYYYFSMASLVLLLYELFYYRRNEL